MTDMRHVRLTPHNPRQGAHALRYTIGGRTFESERWYEMPSEWADMLLAEKQSSGVPYFQVVDQQEFENIARAELAAAYMVAGQALPSASIPHPNAAPKVGPTDSQYAGMPKVREIDPRNLGVAASRQPAAQESSLETKSRTQLVVMAKEMGLPVDPKATKTDLKETISAAIKG